ncbi:hypothetical protein EF913_23135 [Streptomyces sp. WAC04189]|nr:hypothetical protein EF913_23135 [Streptomyces sp. WAC04189]
MTAVGVCRRASHPTAITT